MTTVSFANGSTASSPSKDKVIAETGSNVLRVSSVWAAGADVELMCCEFSPDGKWLACGDSGGTVTVLQTDTCQVAYRLHDPLFSRLPVTAVRFRGGEDKETANTLVAAYSSQFVRVWHFTSKSCLASIQEDRQTLAVVYSSDYKYFATAGSNHAILVYDASTNQVVNTLEASMDHTVMDGHMGRVFSLKYHPSDARMLVSAGWDDTVQFWDTRSKHSVRKICGPHVCGDALDIEPFTLSLLTGSWRQQDQLEIWDFGSGKLLRQLHPSSLGSKVYGCCWVSPNTVLVGGSNGHAAFTIDTEHDNVTGELGPLPHGVYGVGYSKVAHSSAVAAGSKLYVCGALDKSKAFITQAPGLLF